MMVIAVIALLMAVSGLVLGNVLTGARVKATEATITKVNGLMQTRQEAFQRAMEKAELSKAVAFTKAFCRAAFPPEIDRFVVDQASDRTWEALARKTYFRAKFPVNFAEVLWFDAVPGTPVDDDGNGTTNFYPPPTGFQYYALPGVPDPLELGRDPTPGDAVTCDDLEPYASLLRDRMTNPQLHTAETESAELLYLILTGADLFGVPPVGEDEFSTSEVRDTDGDGLLEFVDAWGRPLRFYRWPTRLLRCGEDTFTGNTNGDGNNTTPAGPEAWPDPRYASLLISTLPSLKVNDQSLIRDPEDSLGLIYTQVIKRNPPTGGAGDLAARQKLERLFHTPETFHTLLIVSAGPDGNLGLYEPCQFDAASNVMGHLAQPIILGDPSASPLADNITNRRK
jgi:hypothetical protein